MSERISKQQVWAAYMRVRAQCAGTGRDLDALAAFSTDLPGRLTSIWHSLSASAPLVVVDPPDVAAMAHRIADTIRDTRPTDTAITSLRELQGGSRLVDEGEIEPSRTLVSEYAEAEPQTLTHDYRAKQAMLLSDVLVWPHLGLAGDAAGRVIRETCASEKRLGRMLEQDAFVVDRTIPVAGPCTSIEYGYWNNHYHWLIDVLPRIEGLWRAHVQRWGTTTLFVRDVENRERRRLLERLIPPGVRLDAAPIGARLQADRYVHLPCLSEDYCGWLPSSFLTRFREAADDCFDLAAIDRGDERIYISRRLALQRRVLNEPDLEALLARHGFRSYTLETMPLAEQAALFRRARVIVAPHGAGLTNLLFAGPRCRVLELFPGPPAAHYRWLAQAMGQDYATLPGPSEKRHKDFTVDLAAIQPRLDRWL